jgi:hypothetical protein
MLLLGCKPVGRFTEQHDIFFDIGPDLNSLVQHIRDHWPDGDKLHIDAWRRVTQVENYRVDVVPRSAAHDSSPQRLFFINLGGYKPGVFDEFHYKMIVAATDIGEAIRKGKASTFYRHTGFTGAESHIDDKYGVDVDDIYDIQDILPEAVKADYCLRLTSTGSDDQDETHLGYFQLHKL